MSSESDDSEDSLQRTLQPEAPISPLGREGPDADRGADGRFQPGNRAAMVVGYRSAAFWREQEAERQAIERALLSDAGYTPADAPAALKLAVESIGEAVLICRSAFERVAESGGPLTVKGRGRRAYLVWLQAVDRLERGLRLVGLERKPKPVSFAQSIRAANANRETDGE